jgi:hypothetical protein
VSITILILGLGCLACSSTDENAQPVVEPPISNEPKGPQPTEEVPEPSLLDPNRVVARVNDKIFTVRSLRARYGAAIKRMGEAGDAQIRQLLDRFTSDLIAEWLFLEAAERLGVTVTSQEMQAGIDRRVEVIEERGGTLEQELAALGIPRWEWEAEIRRELVTRRLYRMLIGRESPLSPETRALVDVWVRPAEVRGYYERHKEQFRVMEQARVDAIFVRNSSYQEDGRSRSRARETAAETAAKVAKRARAGEDFMVIMKEHQDRPLDTFSRPFRRGQQQAPVEKFVWDKKVAVGDVSDPIAFPSGFLVLRLAVREEDRYRPFEEVRAQIEGYLQDATLALAQVQIQAELLRESVITPVRFKTRLRRTYRTAIQQQLAVLSR